MTSRPRLLFIDQYGAIGGGQRILLSLLDAAVQELAEVGVLAPAGPLEEAIRTRFGDRVAYHRCEEPRLTHSRKGFSDILSLCAYAWRFRKHLSLLKSQQVIYVNGLRHLPHMLGFAPLLPAAVIYHVHLAHSRLERLLIRLAGFWPHTFHIVVNSTFVAEKIRCRRMLVIRNALDSAFAHLPFVNRFDSGVRQVAVFGTLRPEKGQDIAMDAVESRLGLQLHLIGPEGDGAGAWITGLKARQAGNVVFEGAIANLPTGIEERHIQISLVPSRWQEPFGLVAIESMACSCLTIVSGTGGLKEIAADTGAILAKDAGEIGAVLDQLAATPPEALVQLARAQHEAAQRSYAPQLFARQVRELLRAALAAADRDA